jgi:hypothetical protein
MGDNVVLVVGVDDIKTTVESIGEAYIMTPYGENDVFFNVDGEEGPGWYVDEDDEDVTEAEDPVDEALTPPKTLNDDETDLDEALGFEAKKH